VLLQYLWFFHLQLMIVPLVYFVLPFTAYDCSFSIFGPSIYSLWLFLWYIWSFHLQLMIVPSVSLVLPFTAYDCSFGIFGPSIYSLWLFLQYLWSFHLQLMIAPSVSLVLPFTAYDCSFSIFGPSIYSLWLLLRYLQTFLMKRKHWDHINCCLNNQYHIINIGYCNAERYKCPPIEQYKYQWYEWRIVWEHSKK
jgi:hypothetical protein